MVATQEPAPLHLPEMAHFPADLGHLPEVAGMPYEEFLGLEHSPDEWGRLLHQHTELPEAVYEESAHHASEGDPESALWSEAEWVHDPHGLSHEHGQGDELWGLNDPHAHDNPTADDDLAGHDDDPGLAGDDGPPDFHDPHLF
jgi:hypothetical protein